MDIPLRITGASSPKFSNLSFIAEEVGNAILLFSPHFGNNS